MKPFIFVLALALGLGFVSVALAIHLNPSAFTSAKRNPSAIPIPIIHQALPAPEVARLSRMVQLDDVLVVGEFKSRRAPTKRRAPVPETVTHVVPATCVDGAYRKLEDNRGVRLTCPTLL